MPWVPFDTGGAAPERRDRPPIYLCDWPGCTSQAEHVSGCVKELGACAAFCTAHASAAVAGQGGVKPGPHAYRPWQSF